MTSRYQETTGRAAGERLAWESFQESLTRVAASPPPHLN